MLVSRVACPAKFGDVGIDAISGGVKHDVWGRDMGLAQ